MKSRSISSATLLLAAGLSVLSGFAVSAQQGAKQEPKVASAADDDALRIEGDRRFRANCGRCHEAPHKFPPRVMATVIRHMRVRATITDEDMRLILRYMTR